MTDRSILFVNPDYHCSFFLRDELRKRGWKADILRYASYPQKLLWADDCLVAPSWGLRRLACFLWLAMRYDHFLVYGDAEVLPVVPWRRIPRWLVGKLGSPELALLRWLGKRLTFFPSGCRQEMLKADFVKVQDGRVCANCGYEPSCNDAENAYVINLVNRYHSLIIDNTVAPSPRLDKRFLRYKSLDLDTYRPGLSVPPEFALPKTGALRIMHSFYQKGREHGGRNIKGSPFVAEAVARLRAEGNPVEYFFVNDVPIREMRYYQAQADVIVDQLIYGWWGSTAIEAMGLGKPTVCFLLPDWKRRFLAAFPEYDGLPIIEASTETIYDVLKRLVTDPAYRVSMGAEARRFAERHFDAARNAAELERVLLAL